MDLDHVLSCLLSSLEENNVKEAERFAKQALDYVDTGKSLGNIDKDELLFHLNGTLERINSQAASDKRKQDLIESIVNFKGE